MHTLDEIAALLHIHKTAHEVGNLTNVSGAALNRLRQINNEMGPHGFGSEPAVEEPEKVEEAPADASEPTLVDRRL